MPISGIGSAAADDAVADLVTALTAASASSLQKASNLADVASAATARTNLGVPPSTRTVTAGTGLTGGGSLAADRTLSLDFLPPASSYTYNTDGSVATETIAGTATTYTYNTDGSVATMTRSGVTRTYSYNADGSIAGVS